MLVEEMVRIELKLLSRTDPVSSFYFQINLERNAQQIGSCLVRVERECIQYIPHHAGDHLPDPYQASDVKKREALYEQMTILVRTYIAALAEQTAYCWME